MSGATLRERLNDLIRPIPAGSLIPVDWISEEIAKAAEGGAAEASSLTLAEVAELARADLFGGRQTPTEGAVRKWTRDGKDGVRLEAFGRPRVVTPEAYAAFVSAIRAQGRARRRTVRPAAPPAPADEIARFEAHSPVTTRRGRGAS